MNTLLRFSPARPALAYCLLTVLVLALFAIPLWSAWRVNLSTFRAEAKLVASDVTVVVRPDTGHSVLEERPRETADALLRFL